MAISLFKFPAYNRMSSRRFIVVIFLVSGTLAWFFLLQVNFFEIFGSFTNDVFWANVGLILFYGIGAFSAILGSSLGGRIDRRKLIGIWITVATITTASMAIFDGLAFSLLVSISLGFCLGMGFPSCTALFADLTSVEERARVAGSVILIAFLLTFFGMIVMPTIGLGILGTIIFLVFLRAIGLLSLFLDSCEREKGKEKSWRSILSKREFSFYLLPWLMFNVAAGLLAWSNIPDLPDLAPAREIGIPLAYVLTAISGLVAGVIADRRGRKPPIIISLVLFGISFALLSYIIVPGSILIYYVTYGIAWGFLFSLYLTVPGDIGLSGSKEKFYALGTVIPLIVYMSLSTVPQIFSVKVSASLLSPVLSIIIFVSIIPVLRAKETLQEGKIQERKMKDYVEKLGKTIRESEEANQP